MKHILKHSMLLTIISALLIGCASPSADDQKEDSIPENSTQNSASTTRTAGNEEAGSSFLMNPSLTSLFPKRADPNAYSKGITQSSTLWKARQEVPVFATGQTGRGPVTDQIVGTLSQGEEFRVYSLITSPAMDAQCSKIYGQMADGSGWALLYDHLSGNPQTAHLKEDCAWPLKIPCELKSGTILYGDRDGTIPIESYGTQIVMSLSADPDGTLWGQSYQGWFKLFDENGPGFYHNPIGVVVGPFSGNDPLEMAYSRIVTAKALNNLNGELNWGYTFEDLNQDQVPELLIASGGSNQDQSISVYGLTSQVIDSQKDDSFSAMNASFYRAHNSSNGLNEVLIFQTLEDGQTISRIHSTGGSIQTIELSDSEIQNLQADTLQEITFTTINDLTLLNAFKSVSLGTLYPDYVFFEQINQTPAVESSSTDQAPSASTWKLNYDMAILDAPARGTTKLAVYSTGKLITIIGESKNGAETWGKLDSGGWVCLQDAEYVYASPETSNVEQNSSTDWYEAYGNVLRCETMDPQYDSSYTYAPLWYLWTHPEYENPLLVMKTGICEADYQLKFYTFLNGTTQQIASCGAGHSGFYSGSEPGTFYQHRGHMGGRGTRSSDFKPRESDIK